MDDQRVWAFEESLWTATPEHYQESIDGDNYVLVVPTHPHVLSGQAAIEAVKSTPRWSKVAFSDQRVTRPQEGLICVAYKVEAEKEAERYTAYCSSVYRRLGHDDWKVVQHQQTPPLTSGGN